MKSKFCKESAGLGEIIPNKQPLSTSLWMSNEKYVGE